jgi:uncharacterized cupredoxin-like copper-binding protein
MKSFIRSVVAASALALLPGLALAHDQGAAPAADAMAGMHHHEDSFWFGHAGKPADAKRTIKLSAMDIKFMPTEVAIQKGETVKFEIVNDGNLAHEFVLGDAAEQAEHDKEMAAMPGMKMDHVNGVSVEPGKTASLVWTFTKAGSLQYACHVPGHYAAGMVGQLTVK